MGKADGKEEEEGEEEEEEEDLKRYPKRWRSLSPESREKNAFREMDPKSGLQQSSNGKDTVTLEASLSFEGVTVKIDNVEVYKMMNLTQPWGETTARLHAGVHLLILHQKSGAVMRIRNFYTWQPEIDLQLAMALHNVRRGRLIVLLGAPEFTQFLKSQVSEKLEYFGSEYVKGFAMYDVWCWVGWKGGRTLQELLVTAEVFNKINERDVSPLHTHLVIPLSNADECCSWYSWSTLKDRAEFCEKYGGYGDFCSCNNPSNEMDHHKPITSGEESIPVAIVTARRLWQVLGQVEQIRRSPGGRDTPITLFVDGHNQEARDLGKVLSIPVVEHNNSAPNGSTQRINNHVKFSLEQIFKRSPGVNLAIILEDDLELAPDFISYFHQVGPLLLKDSSLLFINAFNYNSYGHTANDPSRLYRAHGIPGYGWITSRSAAREMLSMWAPKNNSNATWDWWIRAHILGTKDMIIPEVPRTRHTGGGGVHISGYDQILFSAQPLNNVTYVKMNTGSMMKEVYDSNLLHNITRAKEVRIIDHPCDVLPIPTNKTGDSYAIYIYQPGENRDHHSYYVISLCLGINDRDPHESYNLMTTFPFYGNQVFVIACPHSPYCHPQNPVVIYKATEDDALYAKDYEFPKATLDMNYAFRIPPKDDAEEYTLQNRMVINFHVP
ncbi:protein O-linked-mannose beta-1,2-N-acetylglucosaminyltransferase 1-like [Palaemon carinicauda]|uniref:protein O-linked-mannose beta-1,2-N-acetylglucosaminyltransferase 1-like n=1 Tax=Palaemon carinicauda TaxID=392227 RepID=UPI0035B68951